ncbi:hypothetical protein MASR1M107_32160 [Ignavibacteriales bacterium]
MLKPVELRHKLHSLPELMYQEFETTKTLFENISEIPGVVIHRPLETGLVVEYTVNDGDYLLFRADIDALPIVEDTGVPFASTNNLMHACGHDVHTSILYRFLLEVVAKKLTVTSCFYSNRQRKVVEVPSRYLTRVFLINLISKMPLHCM